MIIRCQLTFFEAISCPMSSIAFVMLDSLIQDFQWSYGLTRLKSMSELLHFASMCDQITFSWARHQISQVQSTKEKKRPGICKRVQAFPRLDPRHLPTRRCPQSEDGCNISQIEFKYSFTHTSQCLLYTLLEYEMFFFSSTSCSVLHPTRGLKL